MIIKFVPHGLWSSLLSEYDTLYNTFFINDESCAERSHIFAAIHAFLAPYSELFYQLLVGVCNQGKRQIVFLNKFLV